MLAKDLKDEMFAQFQSINIEARNTIVSILEKESTAWTDWASTRSLCLHFAHSCEELDHLSHWPLSCESAPRIVVFCNDESFELSHNQAIPTKYSFDSNFNQLTVDPDTDSSAQGI